MPNKTSVPTVKERQTLDRLNALSDGVLAIVITLLILGIDIPTDHSFTEDGLVKFLRKLEPILPTQTVWLNPSRREVTAIDKRC